MDDDIEAHEHSLLLKSLDHEESEVRQQALEEIEDLVPPRPKYKRHDYLGHHVSSFRGALKLAMDQDEEVRLAAVRVLAKVAPTQDRESADVLLHLVLTDMNEEIMLEAARALEAIMGDEGKIKQREETTGQGPLDRAVESTTLIGKDSIIENLLSQAETQQAKRQVVCIRVLGKLAEGGHREVEKAMLSFFNHDDKQVRQAAVRGLKRAMMPGNYTALKQLVYCLKDESWAVRLAAVDAIISVCASGRVKLEADIRLTAFDHLIECLVNDPQMLVRERCALALSRLGRRGEINCGVMLDVIEDEEFAVQITLVKALGVLAENGDADVVKCLLGYFDDSASVNFLLEAMQSLALVGVRGDVKLCAKFLSCINNRSAAVRLQAIEALGLLTDPIDKKTIRSLATVADAGQSVNEDESSANRNVCRESEAAVRALASIARSVLEADECTRGSGADSNNATDPWEDP